MSAAILRVYDPAECDEQGTPLDWPCCRACGGTGAAPPLVTSDPVEERDICVKCGGHGSLKDAALVGAEEIATAQPYRCEDCCHPMSDGTWGAGTGIGGLPWALPVGTEPWAIEHLRRGDEPPVEIVGASVAAHYSPCDAGCHHGGEGRYERAKGGPWASIDDVSLVDGAQAVLKLGLQASWRQVDVRCLGWPHDLRPEKLAILCLRCLATRTSR